MRHMTTLDRDILEMAEYWGERKTCWLDAASDEFQACVQPCSMSRERPTSRYVSMVNTYFTEWVLFERPLAYGRTPLQLYIDRVADGVSSGARDRLRQVERTQFFSRFAILEKDERLYRAVLSDVRTGRGYEVIDPVLCTTQRWRDGTIAERIACVDGVWRPVGQARLYDRAPAHHPYAVAPGEELGEGEASDALASSYYLRLLRDVLGVEGRYASTLKFVEVEEDSPHGA